MAKDLVRRKIGKKSNYHHGDLNRALLDAAIEHVGARDVESLSCRELAKTVGVSPGAPYHHFRDRSELLAVIAGEGFRILLQKFQEISKKDTTSFQTITRLAHAYVDFGRQNPGYYRTMYLPDVTIPENIHYAQKSSDSCLAILVEVISRALPQGDAQTAAHKATALWAFVHGLVVLSNPGPLRRILPEDQEARFIDRTVAALLSA